jgi:drug/metabolite transporter (DMT)-like permease
MAAMPVLNILAGAVLLLFGRRLFWLFVACVGFIVGAMLARDWFGEQSDLTSVVIALLAGVFGALLAVFVQRVAITVGGFLAGGYIVYTLAFELKHESIAWIAFLIGGIIGAFLVTALFDWALIILSALTGASVIVQNMALNKPASVLLFVVLAIFGVFVQTSQFKEPPPAPNQSPHERRR